MRTPHFTPLFLAIFFFLLSIHTSTALWTTVALKARAPLRAGLNTALYGAFVRSRKKRPIPVLTATASAGSPDAHASAVVTSISSQDDCDATKSSLRRN